MNRYSLALTLIATLLLGSCERNSNSVKSWVGVISEERGDSKFRFTLKRSPEGASGFISVTETESNDVEIGLPMRVEELEVTDLSVSFILPITGEIDEDSVEFYFECSGNNLIGTGREMIEGKDALPIHLRLEEPPRQ